MRPGPPTGAFGVGDPDRQLPETPGRDGTRHIERHRPGAGELADPVPGRDFRGGRGTDDDIVRFVSDHLARRHVEAPAFGDPTEEGMGTRTAMSLALP